MNFEKMYTVRIDIEGEYLYIGKNTWRHESLVVDDSDIEYGNDVIDTLMEMLQEHFDEVQWCSYDGNCLDIIMKDFQSDDSEILPEIEKMIQHIIDKKDIKSIIRPDEYNYQVNFCIPKEANNA